MSKQTKLMVHNTTYINKRKLHASYNSPAEIRVVEFITRMVNINNSHYKYLRTCD